MVTISILPQWRQLFDRDKTIQTNSFDEDILLAESWMSIGLILSSYKSWETLEYITIWIPDFFCMETIEKFKEPWMIIRFYPITNELEPDWNIIKEWKKQEYSVDFFLFVHYFGIKRDVEKAKVFCENIRCFLIEDCTHALFANSKIGKSGDFILFSPHKCLSIPDGAILKFNITSKNKAIAENILNDIKTLQRRKNDYVWLLKRVMQKMFRIQKKPTYFVEPHYGDCISRRNGIDIERISAYSERHLKRISPKQLKEYAYIRHDNLEVMNYLISKELSTCNTAIVSGSSVPFVGAYTWEGLKNKQLLANKLLEKGYCLQSWPDLPAEIKNDALHATAIKLSENIFTVPIHQSIKPQELIQKYGTRKKKQYWAEHLRIEWDKVTKEKWEIIFNKINISNILQDWNYGDVKKEIEGWGLRRGIIYEENQEIGVIQVLYKSFIKIPLLYRVNRGPLLIEQYDNVEYKTLILDMVKKQFRSLIPMLCAPWIEMTPYNLEYISNYHIKLWDGQGFSSSTVDLRKTENELRMSLNSKWRNALVTAEKSGVRIEDGSEDWKLMLRLYEEDKKIKGYSGTPNAILEGLFRNNKNKLIVLRATNTQGELVAYDIFYLHGITATYLIGWNSNKGRRLNANNLLLYQAMLVIKNLGYSFLDLGGIDEIHTETIAAFKCGVNGTRYRLIGECLI
ncbi:GNAT family N-acetyltransferase [Clostridiales bacterium TF09-2AC]|uniref:GNAT family N-acetyltransferase n=1 Tax=Enterocloster hominis (ex Hitch et al. 2024) TaxID=1917870 RepID=UPI000E737C62|nr:GNAT family N-acetyltransferase [Lachnoclostridium pacaense]MCC2878527.1 GNAT family N-acetyltransferase [Lachnoclostridium pacaense]RJW37292.1 GNAT family N-acetyltransferase [Clostridiales bacterium TF09-2AC]